MPDIREQGTVEQLVRAFMTNGRQQEQAMIQTGYSKSYAHSYCGNMWDKPQVKAELARYQAETRDNVALHLKWEREDNLKHQYKQLSRYEDILATTPGHDGALRGIDRVLHELNASSGQHSSTVNTGKQDRKPLTPAQEQAGKAAAKAYTDKIAEQNRNKLKTA